ncbi:MAG: UDP-3-O-(3-hydroxymyristoyl)glucosamine N-acyltransferase [Cytophagales bacterium]|nr:MAG: UDP-3-O-(3-hydroxymyristoyl)glucosamine N-acyltransferase [Cytophagales bacterium]TAF60288.1 MAG: UDP-3-O-(3-hydroxymyristoyl)glucosamine N-acyltransferase [Cytophagales bacterium]
MDFSVQQIATLLGGKVLGNSALKINSVSKIQEGLAGSISFMANPKYEQYLYDTQASAVLVSESFVPSKPYQTTLIVVPDAYLAFTKLLEEYQKIATKSKQGIEAPSFQSDSAKWGEGIYLGAFSYLGEGVVLGRNVKIYPQAYIGDNVRVGDDSVIFFGAKLYANSVVGNNCVIHAGAVIGSDGFGFAPQADGSYRAIPQLGNVILGDDVSIGANTTIDCATMGSTIIEQGVKLDNLIQVAHNVKIGKNTVIAAQTGISGSSEIGQNCIVAGQVGIVGHVKVAHKTTILAQSGVSNHIEEAGGAWLGSPALPRSEALRNLVLARNLNKLNKRLLDLEKQLKQDNPTL